jgi:pimeloyl-ACP methyl ester carboxylesterase
MTTLVLLPGMDGTGRLFAPLLPFLGPEHEPVVVGYPGAVPLDYQELLPLVLAALPQSGRFVLLGESFSGPLAVMASARRPPGLVALVLCASFVCSPLPAALALMAPLLRGWCLRLIPSALQARVLLGRTPPAGLASEVRQAIAAVAPPVLAGRIRQVLAVDARRQLGLAGVPILYLQAGRDRLVPPRCARLVQRLEPRTSVVRIDAPHLVLQTAPAEAAEAIRTFVAAL